MVTKFFSLCFSFCVFFCISCSDFQKRAEKIEKLSGLTATGVEQTFDFRVCKTTFVLVGAAWCPYCKADAVFLNREYGERKDSGFCALYISEDKSLQEMKESIQSLSLTYPALFWNYDMMNQLGNPRFVPTYYIVSGTGEILKSGSGALGKEKMRQTINTISKLND